MRRLLCIAGLISLAAGLEAGAQWHTVAQGDVQVGRAQTTGDQGTPLYLYDLVLSPALAWPGGAVLDPLIYVNSSAQQYSLEEQLLFQQTLAFGARPTYTSPLAPDWKWGARALAQDSKNWETSGEIRKMQGLYDDEEYGGGLLLQRDTASQSTHASLDLSWRDYPYYRSPASAVLSGTAGAILDAWWWKLGLKHHDRLSDDKLLTVNGWVALRNYTDAHVVNVDSSAGSIGAQEGLQRDVPGSLDVALDWRLSYAWAVDVGVGWDVFWSNQNLFDQSGSYNGVTPYPGVAIAGAYNSFATRLDPGLLWQREDWQAHLSGELLLRGTSKPIRWSNGVYTHSLESDTEYGLAFSGGRDLHWYHLRLVGNAAWRVVTSNQEFSQGQPAAYSYYNVSVGLEYQYASQ